MNDLQARLAAALADRYAIVRELGAGGMATVWLAHDLRHDRDVAIKVLHPDLGAALGGERFLAEIRTTAKLQHPHILPLLDSGEAGGLLYYVMPLVTGETLRARLERERQLPVEDALRIAREVADALGAAHAQGIVHRDIKPENILLQDAHALVADFGIALAVQQAGGQRMTQTGLSLGTPQYMSPEQAMGERAMDARSDIYALGAVTYEMLTGEPPFTGPTVQAIVARLVSEAPRGITVQRRAVPPAVEAAVLRALEKLPADRWTTARDFAAALRADAPMPPAPAGAHRASPGPWRPLALGLGLLAAGLAGLLLLRRDGAGTTGVPITYDAALPDSAALSSSSATVTTGFGSLPGSLTISPAGDFVVYPAARGGSSILWWRSLRDASAHSIPGTEGGATPRISPDATRLAFVQGNRTVVIPIGGGEARTLLESDPPQSLEWVSPTRLMAINRDGFNLAWLDVQTGLLENVGIGTFLRRCVFGRWLAATSDLLCWFNEGASIYDPVTSTSTSIRTRNADGTPGPSVSGTGFDLVDGRYLVFVTQEGELRAAAFDHATRTVGRPVEILRGVRLDNIGATVLSRSASGMLAYATGSEDRLVEMIRRGADGAITSLATDTAAFLRFDLSRDRRQLAAVVSSGEGQELRVYDLRTGRRSTWLRAGSIRHPLWSPDGRHILTRVQNGPVSALVYGAPDAATPPDTLLRAEEPALAPDPLHFHDERLAVFREFDRTVARVADVTRRPFALDTLLTDAVFVALSPDGRRIAWHTSSRGELFVSAFPLGGPRVQLATGGVEPVWLSDSELVYRSGVQWSRARFDPSGGALLGAPEPWGRDERFADTPGWSNRTSWDGGIIYARRPPRPDPTFIHVMPRFVDSMKAAVDAADR